MTEQLELISLMSKDSALTPAERRRLNMRCKPRSRGHASLSPGPAGETCGSCANLVHHGRSRCYFKCGLIAWTHGPGTDIRKRDPACSLWKAMTP